MEFVLVLVIGGVESGGELMVAGAGVLPTGSAELSVPWLMAAKAETFSPKLAFGRFCYWRWVGCTGWGRCTTGKSKGGDGRRR